MKITMETKTVKINIGCGKAKLQSWINLDIEKGADIILDLKKGLPFKDNSIQYIYSEHVLEHFSFNEGQIFLKDCFRILTDGGIIRIATPDLDHIIKKYLSDWRNQDWLLSPEYSFITTRGNMLNVIFSWWGHNFLYNEEDLRMQLENAGFTNLVKTDFRSSRFSDLCNLETRIDSKLIIEAEKRLFRLPKNGKLE